MHTHIRRQIVTVLMVLLILTLVLGSAEQAIGQADASDPASPHEAGFYYLHEANGERILQLLEPAPIAVATTGQRWKASVQAEKAPLRISDAHPTFYLYLSTTQSSFPGLSSSPLQAMSPKEFVLTRLESKKTEREIPLDKLSHRAGKRSLAGELLEAQRPSNPRQSDQVQFDYFKISTGVYKIQPHIELRAGEYGFMYGGSLQLPDGKLFDFGIEQPH